MNKKSSYRRKTRVRREERCLTGGKDDLRGWEDALKEEEKF